jgi:hypothetical protein
MVHKQATRRNNLAQQTNDTNCTHSTLRAGVKLGSIPQCKRHWKSGGGRVVEHLCNICYYDMHNKVHQLHNKISVVMVMTGAGIAQSV